jgi:hypothetical protein
MGILARLFGLADADSGLESSRLSVVPAASSKVIIEGGCNSGFEMPLEVPYFSDVGKFFSRAPLPYLWPDHDAYCRSIDDHDRPQDILRDQWTIAFLSHPNSEVVLATLKILDLNGRASVILICLALLLAYGEDSVARESARVTWTGSDWMLEQMMDLLGSNGTEPSGIELNRGKCGAAFLSEACPSNRYSLFRDLALETFGSETVVILEDLREPASLEKTASLTQDSWLEEDLPEDSWSTTNSVASVFNYPEPAPLAEVQEATIHLESLKPVAGTPTSTAYYGLSDRSPLLAVRTPEAEQLWRAEYLSDGRELATIDMLAMLKQQYSSSDEKVKTEELWEEDQMTGRNVNPDDTAEENPGEREHYFVSESSKREEIGIGFQRLQEVESEINTLLLAATRIGKVFSHIGAVAESSPESLAFESQTLDERFTPVYTVTLRDQKDISASAVRSLVSNYRKLLIEQQELSSRLHK